MPLGARIHLCFHDDAPASRMGTVHLAAVAQLDYVFVIVYKNPYSFLDWFSLSSHHF